MRRAAKTFLTWGWLLFTVVIWAVGVTMVLLGRWQLQVSDDKHFNLQNFGYALQWWAFTAFALLFWLKLIRDAWRGTQSIASTSGELVRANRTGLAPVGPAELMTRSNHPDQSPTVYRGYLMPQSRTAPVRSHGDRMHDAYNDYLWQLSLSDPDRTDP